MGSLKRPGCVCGFLRPVPWLAFPTLADAFVAPPVCQIVPRSKCAGIRGDLHGPRFHFSRPSHTPTRSACFWVSFSSLRFRHPPPSPLPIIPLASSAHLFLLFYFLILAGNRETVRRAPDNSDAPNCIRDSDVHYSFFVSGQCCRLRSQATRSVVYASGVRTATKRRNSVPLHHRGLGWGNCCAKSTAFPLPGSCYLSPANPPPERSETQPLSSRGPWKTSQFAASTLPATAVLRSFVPALHDRPANCSVVA